ncbi:MAG: complex I NDUFA9 subunit family protein [Candidatus Rokubacteria bacterium]|nr:complex I NDUFA9 subunit family protein [Candidatus Rokubacteria bacterium]
MKRIFVTGGTGFVGKSVIRALLAHGFLVRCLVRPGSEADLRGFEAIDRVPGDVLEPDALMGSVEGCSAIIHLVGIIREHPLHGVTFERLHTQATANMLAVAKQAGVKRFLHMSALGTRPEAASRYHRTKWEAELAVRASGLDWTIFRPSVIYGPGDEFVSLFTGMLRRLPVVPVLGDGRYRLQPVSVWQVAEGFARTLGLHQTIGQTYDVAGPTALPFDEVLDEIGRALGKPRVRKIHAPMGLVKLSTRLLQWLPMYPVTMDQLRMLEEGSVADPSRFYADMSLSPEPLALGLRRLLAPPR